MSTAVLHQRSVQSKRLSGSSILAIVVGVAIAAALGYAIANNSAQNTVANEAALSALRNEATAQTNQLRSPALSAPGLRNEAYVDRGFARTDAHWSNTNDFVTGASSSVFPRTDSIWSNTNDFVNRLPAVTKPETKTYGPMHLSYADLVAFEGAGQTGFPRTDSIWSGQADVLNGMPIDEDEKSEVKSNAGPRRPLMVE